MVLLEERDLANSNVNDSGFVRVMKKLFAFLKKKDDEEVYKKPILGVRGRQMFILLVFVGFSVFIGYNLLKFTIVEGDMWRQKANNQHMTYTTIKAKRGTIYDSSGTVLAQSSTVWNIIINPMGIYKANEERRKDYDKKLIKWQEDKSDDKEPMEPYQDLAELICYNLAEILDVTPDAMLNACAERTKQYIIAKHKVEKPVVLEVQEFLLKNKINSDCVSAEETSKRYYPNNTLASSVIGFTNFEDNGVYGLEAYYDDYLKGTDGKSFYTKDGLGQGIDYVNDNINPAIDGNSLVLTIDEVLQHYVEKNLEKGLSQYAVINRATAIVMNCKTGGILAMATTPSYNLNNPSELVNPYDLAKLAEMEEEGASEEEIAQQKAIFRETQWKNKAVTELFYPGSIFKAVTCAAALEEEVVSMSSTFRCDAVYEVAGTKIRCWSAAGHGTVDLQQAITKSCNPSFIQIGHKLGVDKFCDYFEAFGFTEKTGIDLPGEAQSLYVPRARMGPVELAVSSFGQTNKITPLQITTAVCALVNGGYLVTPHVVDKIIDSNGNVIETKGTQVKRQVISESTSKQMRTILETIVSQNGGTNAYIMGYRIGGKSGTAERIDEYNAAKALDPNAKMTYVADFAAVVPMDDPEIVILVAFDTPTGSAYYGSNVAAPVVSAIFNDSLEHLGIYPTYTAEQQAEMDAVVPYVQGSFAMTAESTLAIRGFKAKIIGDATASGATVMKQIPSSNTTIKKGSTVVLYLDSDAELEKGKVPNVIGKNAAEANQMITEAGFNIKIVGGAAQNAEAVAVEQSLAPGSTGYLGSAITVTFQYNTQSD